jgi:hypothetical protein
MLDKEYILCSAIWYQDGLEYVHQPKNIKSGLVICGRRHHNCIATRTAVTEINRLCKNVQGFLTNTDRFVDRMVGMEIAYQAGQVSYEVWNTNKQLFSEDLY